MRARTAQTKDVRDVDMQVEDKTDHRVRLGQDDR